MINGFNILVTSFFTSIGNASGSIVIAVLRGVVFIGIGMLILPAFLVNEVSGLPLCFRKYLLWW
ncbi:hypothetical protein [Capnocytophaga granulosa]|uniref:hypothetical protein n=1 Tax=Capnocytophaga granulosa TaxID=45242 RepID=UPI0023F23FFA|nr:hypothetical protein [Capnocytophaga granulosa]